MSSGQPWPSADNSTNGGNGHGSGGRGLFDGLHQRVKSGADQQKNRAAEGLGGIADVFRNASNDMRAEHEMLASYVDMAGDQLRRFADQVRERGVDDMLDDVQRFARRRPGIFIGGAFLIGLGLARFMKSSGEGSARFAYDRDDDMASRSMGYGGPAVASSPGTPGASSYGRDEFGTGGY